MSLNKALNAMIDRHRSGNPDIPSAIEELFQKKGSGVKEHFSVSQLFYCPRWAFLHRAGVPSKDDCTSILKMLTGTYLHSVIQDALESIDGYGYREKELGSKEYSLLGHIDGAIPIKKQLVEIKTVAANGASMIRRQGMPSYYVKQANLYVALWNMRKKTKLDSIWFIVLNRDSMEFVPIEPYAIDEKLQKEILDSVYRYCKMWEAGRLPGKNSKDKCARCSNAAICGKSDSLSYYLKG